MICRPSVDLLCGRPPTDNSTDPDFLSTKLNIGTPVAPAWGNVHVSFRFSTPFRF